MKPFDEIWEFADKIPGSFMRESAEKFYQYALLCKGPLVEVGVDQGRSANILLHAAAITGASVILIDDWRSILVDNWYKVLALALEFHGVKVEVFREASDMAVGHVGDFDLIHIDADHTEPLGINIDCALWLPKLRTGGFACFHDYGSSFLDVKPNVDRACAGWEDLGVWGGLAIRRKPQ